jgi:hypothetical protein
VLLGPVRARTNYVNDFGAPYISTRLWLQHQNPYDASLFASAWTAAGATSDAMKSNPSLRRPVYPPVSLVVLIPLALLPWPVASHALIVTGITAYLAALLLFAKLVPGTWKDPDKPLFLAAGLAFAPAQSSLHVTNVTCLVASLLFIAIYLLLTSPRCFDALAIFCITLSACIKPTIGLLIFPWLLLIRTWRVLIGSLAACAVIAGIALYRLQQIGPGWLTSLDDNLDFVFNRGGTSDLAGPKLTRLDRIDLQPIFYEITHTRTATAISAALIAVILLIVWFRIFSQPLAHTNADLKLLGAASILAIGLLPFYQRYYSAILFLPAILWAFRNLSHSAARAILAISAVFLVNTEVILRPFFLRTNLGIAGIFLAPHLSWFVFALACILLATLRRSVPRAN